MNSSSDFPLYNPLLLKQHVAILGKTGSGKTYTAKGAIEKLLGASTPVVILDPTSAWWGLRLQADGKTPANGHLTIINGRHADLTVDLTAAHAVKLADAICSHRLSVLLDLGDSSVGERNRFCSAFAARLYSACKSPMHVVIDEAHEFAPQVTMGTFESNEMLHNFKRLASQGRSRGLRLMMITQRPAKLHKDVLTCAETLVAMRVIASQDRDAVADWIEGCGDKKMTREVLDSLAQLKRGEGWLWCPELSIGPSRLKFPDIATFDSSATPDSEVTQVSLGAVDLNVLKQQLAEIEVETPGGDDVKALKKRIVELEQKVRTPSSADPADIAMWRREGGEQVRHELAKLLGPIFSDIERLEAFAARIGTLTRPAKSAVLESIIVQDPKKPGPGPLASAPPPATERGPTRSGAESGPGPRAAERAKRGPGGASGDLSGPARKLLGALVWWVKYADREQPSRSMVAAIAGFSSSGGHFKNTISECVRSGLIETGVDWIRLTPLGLDNAPRDAIKHYSPADAVLALCDGPQRRVMQVLLAHTEPLFHRQYLAKQAGFSSEGGHFKNVLSSLRQMGVIDTRGTQVVRTAWLGK